MAKQNVTLRIDEEIREEAEALLGQMGLSLTTAVNAFMRETIREGKLPFELKGDDRAFWDNVDAKLRESMKYAQEPGAVWYSKDETHERVNEHLENLKAGI